MSQKVVLSTQDQTILNFPEYQHVGTLTEVLANLGDVQAQAVEIMREDNDDWDVNISILTATRYMLGLSKPENELTVVLDENPDTNILLTEPLQVVDLLAKSGILDYCVERSQVEWIRNLQRDGPVYPLKENLPVSFNLTNLLSEGEGNVMRQTAFMALAHLGQLPSTNPMYVTNREGNFFELYISNDCLFQPEYIKSPELLKFVSQLSYGNLGKLGESLQKLGYLGLRIKLNEQQGLEGRSVYGGEFIMDAATVGLYDSQLHFERSGEQSHDAHRFLKIGLVNRNSKKLIDLDAGFSIYGAKN
jgi:hypothetical protein